MVVKLEELRRQLDAAPRVNGGHRRYPAMLKARAVEYINGQRRAGKTLSHIAKNLGVAIQTFSHWGPVPKKSLAKPTGIKPVVMVPSIGGAEDAGDARVGLSVELVEGHRVEGLSLGDTITLLKALR